MRRAPVFVRSSPFFPAQEPFGRSRVSWNERSALDRVFAHFDKEEVAIR